MNKKDKSLFKQWHTHSIAYMVIGLAALFLTFLLIGSILSDYVIVPLFGQDVEVETDEFIIIKIAVVAVIDIAFLIYKAMLKKKGAASDKAEPYRVKLNFSDKEQILKNVNDHTELKDMGKDVFYAFKSGKKSVRLLFMSLPEYTDKEYNKIKNRYIRRAKNSYEPQMDAAQMYKMISVNVLLLDKMNEIAENNTKINVERSMQSSEAELNVIVDLENMEMIIPACHGVSTNSSSKYVYGVETLLKVMK